MSAALVALINLLAVLIPEFAALIKNLANKEPTALAQIKEIVEPWPLDAALTKAEARVKSSK